MARLIPEHLKNNKGFSSAHRNVASALSVGLDSSVMVWFEPPFEPVDFPHHPDFIVLDPAIGLAVVMVFEQQSDQECLGVLRGELRVVDASGETVAENPINRAAPFVRDLREEIGRDATLKSVWVEGIAAFPHVTHEQAVALGFDSIVPLENCLFKGDLAQITRGDSSLLPNLLTRVLEGGVPDLLDDDQIARVRSIVHPEVRIGRDAPGSLFIDPTPHISTTGPGVAGGDSGDDQAVVMSLLQEQYAKRLLSGHRVIHGVAGSGKTLVLVTRASLLARSDPTKRILVTCYTKSLASVLRSYFEGFPNVTVRHLDDIAAEVLRSAGVDWPGGRDTGVQYSMAMEASAKVPLPTFDAVLVDEAQDFNDDALRMCVAMAEPGEDGMGDLLIVADSAQRIFSRRFTWSAAGIQARGRTNVLRHNYRNTRQLLAFARSFVETDAARAADPADPHVNPAEVDELSVDDETVIIAPEATERDGPFPTVTFVDDTDDEIDAVVKIAADWYRPGMPPRSIAVLLKSSSSENRAKRLVAAMEAQGLPIFWATANRKSKNEVGSTDSPIVVSTVHSAKGLEFPKVVQCGVGPRGKGDDAVRNRSVLYVGLTRATAELAVVCHRSSEFAPSFSAAAAGLS